MKKTIYLFDENGNKVMFQYDELSELKEEFQKRGITIGYRAIIGDGAIIGNGIELQKNFYIVGSKHPVTYTGNDTLSIGCYNYSIEKWLEKFEIVGQKESYSENQIEEYKQYILMAQMFAKID